MKNISHFLRRLGGSKAPGAEGGEVSATPMFIAEDAEISGHLFENPRMGVPRRIYWSCSILFSPIADQDADDEEDYEDDEFEEEEEDEDEDEGLPCSLLCDWITWPIRSWREIDGLTLGSCTDPSALEASLYFFGRHQPLSQVEMSFQQMKADRFRVRGSFRGDLEDWNGNLLRGATGTFDVEAPFLGLSVSPDNFFPKPNSEAEVLESLGKFADLRAFERPRWEDPMWTFKPRIAG